MIHEVIHLKDHFPMLEFDATLEAYCPDNFGEFSEGRKRRCVIVFPGGGYNFVSEREGEPVALRFLGYDIASFVLKYTVKPQMKHPYPIVEALAAIAFVRHNASKYHIDENKIAVCGFSAGGHLAGTVSEYYWDKDFLDFLKLTEEDTKVNCCILGYPVISEIKTHQGTMDNISDGDPKLKEKYSLEKHVTDKFPRTFIWHTTWDNTVPVSNSLVMARALEDKHILFELHVYPALDHGQSLADESVFADNFSKEHLEWMRPNRRWIHDAIAFLKNHI